MATTSSIPGDRPVGGVGRGRVTYEEYHPYGSTAWWAEAASIQVSQKRYRYTGMEKDEETGLSYHSARYYATWLGRWCSADPIRTAGGIGGFNYVMGRPTVASDASGLIGPVDRDERSTGSGLTKAIVDWFAEEPSRVASAAQIVGGGLEFGAGATLAAIPEPISTAVGIAVGAHGVDTITAGWRGIFSDEYQRTQTEAFITRAAYQTGASRRLSRQVGFVGDVAIGSLGGYQSLPEVGIDTISTSGRCAVGAPALALSPTGTVTRTYIGLSGFDNAIAALSENEKVDGSTKSDPVEGAQLEGRREVEVSRPDGSTITDIDEIQGGVLWEHKTAEFPFDAAAWIEKHINKKVERILEARTYLPGYENAPVGFRIGDLNDADFKTLVEETFEKLRAANPGVDIRLEWVVR